MGLLTEVMLRDLPTRDDRFQEDRVLVFDERRRSSVPKRGPRTIIQQPTPTKKPIKNGPEIIDFRPVL
jgi:hypothetical protein